MSAIITWLFSLAASIFSLITGNWFTMAVLGTFLVGLVLTLIFGLFGKRRK